MFTYFGSSECCESQPADRPTGTNRLHTEIPRMCWVVDAGDAGRLETGKSANPRTSDVARVAVPIRRTQSERPEWWVIWFDTNQWFLVPTHFVVSKRIPTTLWCGSCVYRSVSTRTKFARSTRSFQLLKRLDAVVFALATPCVLIASKRGLVPGGYGYRGVIANAFLRGVIATTQWIRRF